MHSHLCMCCFCMYILYIYIPTYCMYPHMHARTIYLEVWTYSHVHVCFCMYILYTVCIHVCMHALFI